jgi:hypothetical protein
MLMNSLSQRMAVLVLLAAVAGCSTIKDAKDTVGGWVGGSNTLETSKKAGSSNAGPLLKYAATLRVSNYVDQRKTSNPRYLGVLKGRVVGMNGDEILMDQDVTDIVTNSIAKRFETEGYQVVEGGAPAVFEVSGVVKALTLNVKERDDILITIETTLKEIATGKVVWSGSVTEKNDRFAGVSGNNKGGIVSYLNKELRITSTKTVEAISASLMASRPDLFNLTPGTKPVPGVTVFVAPQLPKVAAPVMMPNSVAQPSVSDAPVSNYKAHASETAGLLLVNTNPSRARVYLDGVYYGMSPLRLEMEPGIHAISVKLVGYNMVTEKVSVRRGDNTEMELNLEH